MLATGQAKKFKIIDHAGCQHRHSLTHHSPTAPFLLPKLEISALFLVFWFISLQAEKHLKYTQKISLKANWKRREIGFFLFFKLSSLKFFEREKFFEPKMGKIKKKNSSIGRHFVWSPRDAAADNSIKSAIFGMGFLAPLWRLPRRWATDE